METGEINVKEYINFNIEGGFGNEVSNQISEERTKNLLKDKESYINMLVKKCQEEYEELVKTNELLKKEQEYSKSLLDGIGFRDGRIKELNELLAKEQAYSRSLMDGITFRDSEINKMSEEAGDIKGTLERLDVCMNYIQSEIENRKNKWKILSGKISKMLLKRNEE